ncbi:MAG: hypothetical protein ACRDTC_12705 [Pseudonocardiaceae bacterium]
MSPAVYRPGIPVRCGGARGRRVERPFYSLGVRQLSLFSDQAKEASPADLAGLLCAQGQVHGFGRGTAARVSIVVADRWRAVEILQACQQRALPVDRGRTEENHYWVRTAFLAGLLPLATAWTRGAVKAVPSGWQLDGAALRLWVVAAGIPEGRGYLLGLDPHAPGTQTPLVAALAAVGLAATPLGTRSGQPSLRISGRRRLARLAEMVGDAPRTTPTGQWPS